MTYTPRPPCNECRRCHRGPRCLPSEARSVSLSATIPSYVDRALRERFDWGERSAFITRALLDALALTDE
jgi:hypothetical protein